MFKTFSALIIRMYILIFITYYIANSYSYRDGVILTLLPELDVIGVCGEIWGKCVKTPVLTVYLQLIIIWFWVIKCQPLYILLLYCPVERREIFMKQTAGTCK